MVPRFARNGLVIASLCVLAVACSNSKSKSKQHSAGNSQPGDVFTAAGPGVFIAAAWPDQWSKRKDLEQSIRAALPEPLQAAADEVFVEVDQATATPWQTLRSLAPRFGLPELPDTLPGLDESRPLIVSLLLPLGSHEQTAATLVDLINKQDSVRPFGLRHRLVVPSSKPDHTRAALAQAAASGGLTAREDGKVYGDDTTLIRLNTGVKLVTVDVVVGGGLGAVAGDELDALFVDLADEPVDPALAADAASVIRMAIDFERLERMAPSLGITMVARVLPGVARADLRALLMQGYAESLTPAVVMNPEGRLVSQVIIDVPASSPGSPYLAARLTDIGQRSFASDDTLAAGKPVPLLDVDWTGIALASPAPTWLAPAGTASDMAELVHMCGWSCSGYLLVGNGLPIVRTILADEPGFVDGLLTQAAATADGLRAARVTLSDSTLVLEPLRPTGQVDVAASGKAAAPPSPAEDCYRDALVAVRSALEIAAREPSDRTPEILKRVQNEQSENLACAGKDPDLADRAESLTHALTGLDTLAADQPSEP